MLTYDRNKHEEQILLSRILGITVSIRKGREAQKSGIQNRMIIKLNKHVVRIQRGSLFYAYPGFLGKKNCSEVIFALDFKKNEHFSSYRGKDGTD